MKIAKRYEVYYTSATGEGVYQSFPKEKKALEFISELKKEKIKSVLFEPDDEVFDEYKNDRYIY